MSFSLYIILLERSVWKELHLQAENVLLKDCTGTMSKTNILMDDIYIV